MPKGRCEGEKTKAEHLQGRSYWSYRGGREKGHDERGEDSEVWFLIGPEKRFEELQEGND
jgi:hypothetical protein